MLSHAFEIVANGAFFQHDLLSGHRRAEDRSCLRDSSTSTECPLFRPWRLSSPSNRRCSSSLRHPRPESEFFEGRGRPCSVVLTIFSAFAMSSSWAAPKATAASITVAATQQACLDRSSHSSDLIKRAGSNLERVERSRGAKSSLGWSRRFASPCSYEYRRNVLSVLTFGSRPYGQNSLPITASVSSTCLISQGSITFSAAVSCRS